MGKCTPTTRMGRTWLKPLRMESAAARAAESDDAGSSDEGAVGVEEAKSTVGQAEAAEADGHSEERPANLVFQNAVLGGVQY